MGDILGRIDALLANTPPSEVEEFEVCRCLRDARAEIERLRQHRCLWGDDPSGPTFSDEYLESLKALSDTVAELALQRYQPEVK